MNYMTVANFIYTLLYHKLPQTQNPQSWYSLTYFNVVEQNVK